MDAATRLAPVCEAIARLLSPHAEVILHDPATDRIAAIWNPVSGRSVGDPSLLGELRSTGQDVHGPYPKSLSDGRRLSSVSAVVRGADGDADLVLCVNVDRTAFDEAARLLAAFAAPEAGRPGALFERDWTETLNDVVGSFVREVGTPVDRLARDQRLTVLGRLDTAGVLGQRRSAPVVARALRISRSALYQLLADLREDPDAP
ncbi:PAS domain-containing protein [Umezawaea sp. Da 62-37]|uniref:helix-turn-helix transcriptional regulator n=1 Tax=Umezawaea sp. Da 62-37 TaxID=3075927 RepID=UPI0028F717A1|nr:PAS domain-containing protein [Umezawaea sp. Da 62-37]WNV84457.1 PAS domain-containing protein [Umezawaea sp. Da 62-37]